MPDDISGEGYANFYHGDECLYSLPCQTIREAEKLADVIYQKDCNVDDWSYTQDPICLRK